MSDRVIDLTGKTFSRLTVLRQAPYKTYSRQAQWWCSCVCGKTIVAASYDLRRGHTTSCGCIKGLVHGLSYSLEYPIWQAMKDRCYNKNNSRYKDYGARGITVCDRWRDSFEAFYEDMGKRPNSELSLDRIDNDKGYSPDNCRWATHSQQQLNKRRSA